MDGFVSYLSPLGFQYNSCGYCNSKPRSTSACYWASSTSGVHPVHYQKLADRGWRRSGIAYYKPDVRHSCCPHYTIRLDAAAFKPIKDQRQAVNRFSKYILGQNYAHKAARLCPKTKEEKKHRRNHFDIAEAINQFQYCNVKKPVDPATKDHIEPAHKFEIILEPDTFTEEKYALFEQYQRTVHKEPPSKISRSGFKSFLCSGLGQDTIIRDGKELKVGSYHQCYRIDGHLIGLGVLDLLPHAVSSVYLIYDQSVNDYNFGKISALQEINFAAEAGYGFYYMGYYIHSCIKMRYKATYHPTYILDPEAYYWDLLSPHVLALLSSRLYLSLSRERRLGLINQSFDVDHALSNEPVPLTDPQERTTKSEISKDDLEYINGQGRLLTDYRKSSIFDLSVPGVMAAEEVSGLPQFAEWTIKSGDFIARLSDLADWDTTEVTDPFSIKGIAAELAACIGSEVIKESVIEWHH